HPRALLELGSRAPSPEPAWHGDGVGRLARPARHRGGARRPRMVPYVRFTSLAIVAAHTGDGAAMRIARRQGERGTDGMAPRADRTWINRLGNSRALPEGAADRPQRHLGHPLAGCAAVVP